MLIGAHVSIAGGIDLAVERGEAMGADCIQTFASSPRSFQFSPISQDVIDRYRTFKRNSSITLHVFHGIYLINLASEKKENVTISVQSLVHYQQTAKAIGAIGTIFHVGSHKGIGFDAIKHQVAEAITEILKETPEGVTLILENAAGHKGTIGQTVDELAELFSIVRNTDRLGLCLDTQHAFASGVDARKQPSLHEFLTEVDRKIGLSFVKVIHVNDSKFEFDSHRDRHENIGEGFLGDAGIGNWINHPNLNDLPFILEVPGILKKGPGIDDINRLRDLCKSNT